MGEPLVAIVGSADPARKAELGLIDPEATLRAGEEMGDALAKRQCRIIVYTAAPEYIEAAVVRGYLRSGQAGKDSVVVRYPADSAEPAFPEKVRYRGCLRFEPDTSGHWEVSFYRSLDEASGVILVGGGRSTLIAGIVAISKRIPVAAIACFGGAARDVWRDLPARHHLTTPEELQLMGQAWSPGLAPRLVEALFAQMDRLAEEERLRHLAEAEEKQRLAREAEERQHVEIRRQQQLRRAAWVAAAIMLLAIAGAAALWNVSTHYDWLVVVLFILPAATGVAGANIKRILDAYRGGSSSRAKYSATVSPLGLAAGAVAGVLYSVGQFTAFPDLTGAGVADTVVKQAMAKQAAHLIPFALVVGVIGGFTSERFFGQLVTHPPGSG